MRNDDEIRCAWCGSDPLYMRYHDEEWGVPVFDDRKLFEMLILEGAQAGLSWLTILKRREGYRRAFADFDAEMIARFTDEDKARLKEDAGIVRNRLKIEATVRNAQAYLSLREGQGSLADFLWKHVDHAPIQNAWKLMSDLPAETVESKRMSSDLKQHGFSFVGPTICYAFMQAVGMVNDHVIDCFRHGEIWRMGQQR